MLNHCVQLRTLTEPVPNEDLVSLSINDEVLGSLSLVISMLFRSCGNTEEYLVISKSICVRIPTGHRDS